MCCLVLQQHVGARLPSPPPTTTTTATPHLAAAIAERTPTLHIDNEIHEMLRGGPSFTGACPHLSRPQNRLAAPLAQRVADLVRS